MIRTSSPTIVTPKLPTPRSGATLVEVLMSILIMSIGLASLIALFPVSLLSSIRATQLTNGRILADNVQEMVRTAPALLLPPAGGGSVSFWEPAKAYSAGDMVVPQPPKGGLFPEPYIYLTCDAPGTSGGSPPDWASAVDLGTNPIADGTTTWTWRMLPRNYVIDPIGYHRSAAVPQCFGHNPDTSTFPEASYPPRSAILPTNDITATRLFSSPDSWSMLIQELPLSITVDSTTATFEMPTNVDVSGLPNDTNYTRVVLTTPDRTRSLIRRLDPISAGSNVIVENVPANIQDYSGPLRIENFTPRYSYLITVYHNGDDPNTQPQHVQCVIFFNRQTSYEAEFCYKANFGNRRFTGDPDVTDSSLQSDQVKIAWDSSADPEPFLKVGAYVCDARNALFYRIVAVQRSGQSAVLTLGKEVEVLTGNQVGLAMLMPGVLGVYEIGGQ